MIGAPSIPLRCMLRCVNLCKAGHLNQDQRRDTKHSNQSALQGGSASHMLQILAWVHGANAQSRTAQRLGGTQSSREMNVRGHVDVTESEYGSDIAARRGQCGSVVGAWG